jgi:beta-glucosidase
MRALLVLFVTSILLPGCANQLPYKNTQLPVDRRVEDLVSRMTLEEKVAQMSHLAPAIERLGVIEYGPNFDNPYGQLSIAFSEDEADEFKKERPWEHPDQVKDICLDGGWWNEALHGVARAGLATAFPQSIGLGSTWDPDIIQKMTDVAGTEARIHNQIYGKKLTYWSPTINILRDPRWGRTEESYSEDPYLLSRMAVAFVKGFQGNDPKYLKAVATLKHFVANNSEYNRHTGSSNISERFLREYYLYAFQAGITEGGAYSVMGAYNAINGVPAGANKWLLDDVLRGEWGFKGYVVSDCGAISDIVHGHKYETDPEKAVASAAKAGTDLECETCETEQFMYDKYLLNAVKKGYITEKDIDKNVTRLFRARFLLGEFDPPQNVPYNSIPKSKLDCKEHRDLALQIAKETIVLLKNQNGALPLDRNKIKSIAVIGPNADRTVLGGYSGSPSVSISPLQGLKDKVGGDIKILYSEGCNVMGKEEIGWDEENDRPVWKILDERKSMDDAAQLAGRCDRAIVFAGTNLDVANEAADRTDLGLPGNQLELIRKVHEANPNTVVVLINGMALAVNWVDENIPAIVEAWYPGQAGGAAIADVLFGDYNPGGKLPVTFYRKAEDLPPLGDYDITKGRTYWFFEGDVLYPFGYGLSYTTFEYKNLKVSSETFDPARKFQLAVSVDIQNTGPVKGDEVVQLYVKAPESSVIQPAKKLRKFKRVTLDKGRTKKVTFVLSNEDFAYWSEKKKEWYIKPGQFEIQIGSSSTDIKLKGLITASHSAPLLSLLSTDIAGTIHQCTRQKDTRCNQQPYRPIYKGV